MTCTLVLTESQQKWFASHKIAWTIVDGGKDDIVPENSAHQNLVALLANMADYGKRTWQYEPGNTTHATNTLKGLHKVTDCGSLADMFQQMAINLGYTNAKTWHIKPDNEKDRIVTEPGLVCFTGQVGDPGIEGRWCFGDHWVVQCDAKCYDPTFNETFSAAPLPPYFGYWAKYVWDQSVFGTHYFDCDGGPKIYTAFIPGTPSRAARPAIKGRAGFCGIGRRAAQPAQAAVQATAGKFYYTFNKTDKNGKELLS
ncbi:hypothetical protein KY495_11580 [Massilia sp. PAMC28688]|uniref:hypothetical protein n=1 Tax=Massilia sp. PAMC28688 TaxID=2861283 RepID=UPI001C62ABBF|nr:hypothetical protein [Massilia sp. PAMC28688]QYF95731.1 hypothetical protein KY495_11580 [Massilia sp. PAMC28688]